MSSDMMGKFCKRAEKMLNFQQPQSCRMSASEYRHLFVYKKALTRTVIQISP